MFSDKDLVDIFNRTDGHCHFCGDKVAFKKYGLKSVRNTNGVWEADHVIQKAKGGTKDAGNCLAACYQCNRLRWHRKGDEIRELLTLGLIAKDEIKKGSQVGRFFVAAKSKRKKSNIRRRRGIAI